MEIRNNITSELIKKCMSSLTSTKPSYGGVYGVTIYFYEWSDLSCTPKTFNTYYQFYQFCETCGIEITQEIRTGMYDMPNVIYTVCKQGKPELLYAASYTGLTNIFNNAK